MADVLLKVKVDELTALAEQYKVPVPEKGTGKNDKVLKADLITAIRGEHEDVQTEIEKASGVWVDPTPEPEPVAKTKTKKEAAPRRPFDEMWVVPTTVEDLTVIMRPSVLTRSLDVERVEQVLDDEGNPILGDDGEPTFTSTTETLTLEARGNRDALSGMNLKRLGTHKDTDAIHLIPRKVVEIAERLLPQIETTESEAEIIRGSYVETKRRSWRIVTADPSVLRVLAEMWLRVAHAAHVEDNDRWAHDAQMAALYSGRLTLHANALEQSINTRPVKAETPAETPATDSEQTEPKAEDEAPPSE